MLATTASAKGTINSIYFIGSNCTVSALSASIDSEEDISKDSCFDDTAVESAVGEGEGCFVLKYNLTLS